MRCYRAEPDPFPAASAPPVVRVLAAVRSDCGLERSENQDRGAIADAAGDQSWEPPAALSALAERSAGFYALVCDGMGGEAGGAIASGLALETIASELRARWVQRSIEPAGEDRRSIELDEKRIAHALAASFEAASQMIKRAGREQPIYARMGTTATLATIAHGALLCAQVGDSRAYVLRGDHLAQITEDQTMAELLRRSGGLSREQIASVVGPNVILQALGSSTELEVAFSRTPLADGDIVLLCSDGLYGVVDDDTIARELRSTSGGASDHGGAGSVDLGVACDRLIALANEGGGPDNITCAAFMVSGSELLPATAPLAPLMLTPPFGVRR
jgi:serine/threonine protein phosphatase PrpC